MKSNDNESSMKDFEVIKTAGQGSYGTVFKVKRKADGVIYAIKSLKIYKMDKKNMTNTLNEIRILCSFEHQNICGY